MVTVRKMELGEAKAAQKAGRKAFTAFERLFVGVPKDAMVAILDGQIVGGIFIKYMVSDGKKTGYIDIAFVDPSHHGKGIATALYDQVIPYLFAEGCTALTALVKDDNVGSWKLLLNHGFSRVSLPEAVRHLGFKGMALQYFVAPLFASNGMELYLAVKDTVVKPKEPNSIKQICLFLLANSLLLVTALPEQGKDFPLFLCAYLVLLLGSVLFGYIGTLFSKKQWRFRLNNGGAALIAGINFIGGLYPMIGNWYPAKYENTAEFRKAMGMTALCEWLGMIAMVLTGLALYTQHLFFRPFLYCGYVFLLYRMIPIYPFESYGSSRVYRWNKWIYVALTVLSGGILVLMRRLF